MSISYEEALSTLESMFGAPWTRETLDLVLRHFNGHMENTVESILGHGEGDPQALVSKLDAAKKQDTSLDEQLARQLSKQGNIQQPQQPQQQQGGAMSSTASGAAQQKGRGTPTDLPADFLRIPGAGSSGAGAGAAAAGTSTGNTLQDDEALARMLQDELFSQELARNPDLAHLSRGRQTASGPGQIPAAAGYPGNARGAAARPGEQAPPPMPTMPEIMDKVSELGNNARQKLSLMAAQFRANTARFQQNHNQGREQDDGKTYPEMRGLLDDDTDMMELAARKDL